jgi:hypothetical protein
LLEDTSGAVPQDLINGSSLFKSSSNLIQYLKNGDFNTAVKDFFSLGPNNVRPLPNPSQPGALLGELPDGSVVNARPGSSFGSPTLEIQTPSGPDLKFRYQ